MSIIFTLDDFTKVEKVTMPWAGETYFIPAGTPMSADGIANDGNAIGILAESARLEYEYDYGTNPYGKVDYTYSIITHGYVNTEDAEASFGGTYSDECRSALNNIVFCDNHKLPTGGGGAGEVVTVTIDYDSGTATMDKTFEEILSLDNPRFVSNDGLPYSIAYIADDGLQLYAINFNNIGRPEETTMYVEVIEATRYGDSFNFNSGEYKLTEN